MNAKVKNEIIKNTFDNKVLLRQMSKNELFPDEALYAPILERLEKLHHEYISSSGHGKSDILLELKSINAEIHSIYSKVSRMQIDLFQQLNEELKKESSFVDQ